MVAIGFGKAKDDDVVALIAAKKYARAVEVLKEQLRKRGANPSLRMQLADVLILADKKLDAITLLLPLADQYANEGFAAKAVSVLKKVQKLDPGRRDVEMRLARLIEEKQREAVVLPSSRPQFGIEGPPGMDAALPADGPGLEIGFEAQPISAPAPPAPVPLSPAAAASDPSATLPVDSPLVPAFAAAPQLAPAEPALQDLQLELPPAAVTFGAPAAVVSSAPAAEAPPQVVREEPALEDYDLLYAGDGDDSGELLLDAEAVVEEPAGAEGENPMSAGQFADELMSLVDSVFRESPAAPAPKQPARAIQPSEPAPTAPSSSQIVVSPLFRDFSVDEMVAVIQGLKLLGFERGDVILREGQPGASLYMLTSGRVRAFKKDAASGKQNPIGDLQEGAFFGEMSILTGRPRTASVVALSRCELLELDRPTLDEITKSHPHVWDVLREFASQRVADAVRRS